MSFRVVARIDSWAMARIGWRLALATVVALVAGAAGRTWADPAGIALAEPTVVLPANYILESDPEHATLAVEVSTVITRTQFCPGQGNLFVPCPTQTTPIRIVVSLGTGGRPLATAQLMVNYDVPGVANLPVTETVELELEPDLILSDAVDYQLRVDLSHVDDLSTGLYVRDASETFSPYRIAHFTGVIAFGEVSATFDALNANPIYLGDSEWTIQSGPVLTGHGQTATHTAQAPPPLTVQRSSRGDLTVLNGAMEVAGPKGFEWLGWTGERGLTLLTEEGLVAESITINLPPGVGWRLGLERRLRPTFQTSGVAIPLDEDLNPVGEVSGTTALPMGFFSETYPVEFSSQAWTWRQGALLLQSPATRFVRRLHYQDWENAPGEGDIPESNDGFWYLLRPVAASGLVIRPGLEGGISVDLRFNSGVCFSHFPLAALQAPEGGSMRIADNRVVPADSAFPGALAHVLYGKGCRDAAVSGEVPDPEQALEIAGVTLQFTPSAGLWAEGTMTTTQQNPDVERHLEIGLNGDTPTHETDPFQTFRFYMPGGWVPHADGFDSPADANATVDDTGEDPLAFNPARYLLSGVRPDQAYALEHPRTAAYAIGLGDYAGANFRHFDGLEAVSHVGGVDIAAYPLTDRVKYYARRSGVSGIHESALGPTQLPAYGYDLTLTSFGLSYLGNTAHDSRIDGTLFLPHPSAFSQAFTRLMLSCCGNLEEGQIDPADNQKQLAYWSATRVVTRSLRFTHDPNEPCATDDALLELGITADVAHLDEEPAGFLHPRPDGTLVPTDDLERESHLALSPMAQLAGYPFTAVRRAYFNDYAQHEAGPGWINLAGLAGVSFFRDLELHGHVLGSSAQPPPPLFIKGGWTGGGETYFTQAAFDPGHRGFPPGETPGDYQTGDTHLAHARQVWFGTVPFDYPVRFDSLTRTFRSPQPKGLDLVVLDTESELERLNAELADLRFSAFLDLSLLAAPEFLVEEGASWITDHLEQAAVDQIRDGLNRLSELLDAQMRRILDQVVLPALEVSVVVPLVNNLPANGNAAAIDALLDQYLVDPDNPFTEGLQGLADFAGAADNLTEEVADTLGSATAALESVRNVLMQLQQAEQLLDAGLEALGIDLDALSPELKEQALAELELDGGPGVGIVGRLVEIREAIQELEAAIGELTEKLEQGQQFFEQLRDTVFTPVAEYAQAGLQLRQRLATWLKNSYALEPGAYAPEELRLRVRLEIRDIFAATPVAASLQTVIRTWVYNTDAAVREALDTAFQAVNDQIVSIAQVALEEVTQALQPVKTFSSVVESVNWNGRAQIRGDRLSLLRLDNKAIVNLPTPLPGVQVPVEFTGFYEYRELTSDGPVGCLGGVPGRANEILLGSSAGPASMFASANKLTIETKFTRTEDGQLLQLAGGLEMEKQGPDLQAIGLQEFSATLSIGPAAGEMYLSAYCRGRFVTPAVGGAGPTEVAGGALFGRTCSADALVWDPEAEAVLGGMVDVGNPFTGAYLFGEGTVPLVSVACILKGSVSAGVRTYVRDTSFDPANLDASNWQVGGRIDGGVSAEFLCLAKLKGSADLTFQSGPPSRFVGGAEVDGKLGICPFCVEFGGEVTAEHVQDEGWSVSY